MSADASESSGYGLSNAQQGASFTAPDLPYLPAMPVGYRPKVGLVGCGGISEYHLRAYQELGLEVVALCDLSREKAEARQKEFYPEADVLNEPAEVFAHDDIDVVDIATHPAPRVALVEAALRAGKHVLSQKPFALDLDVARRLVTLAEEQKRLLAVNQNGRWAPHFSYLNQVIQTGLIGKVTSIDFTLQWDHTWTKGTPFEDIHHLVLYDFAIHWFDIATVFLGGRTPKSVSAQVTAAADQTIRPPCLAQVVADYGDAQVRMAFNAHVIHGQEDRTVICGTEGTARSFGPSLTEQTVTLSTAEGDATPTFEGNWFANGFQGTMAELLSAIAADRAPSNAASTVIPSLEFCFAAIASADQGGAPVRPGEITKLPGS